MNRRAQKAGANGQRGRTLLYPDGTPVSYWLVPALHDRALLKKSIDALAQELDAPRFDPHVTLFSTMLAEREDPAKLLAAVAKQFDPLRLICGATGHSGKLFKTLYIEFSYQAVSPLANAIRDRAQNRSSYRLEPHLSLLYREVPKLTRQTLAAQVNFSGKGIRFSHIAAVIPGSGQADFHDVQNWQVCASEALSVPISSSGSAA